MSQLNNKKENNKYIVKIIIFLTIFMVVSIGITAGLIYYTNANKLLTKSNSETNQNTIQKNFEEDLAIKSLTEQYNENDIKINIKEEHVGEKADADLPDSNKLNIYYSEISGLKDKSIEEKINKEIKNYTCSLCSDEELEDKEINEIGISAHVWANFSNTLSIRIQKSLYKDKNDIEEVYSLNYNLTTGEKIKFKDLFTNASIKSELIEEIYNNLLVEIYNKHRVTKEELLDDASKFDLTSIEEQTYSLVNEIIADMDNITNFYYDPEYITFEYKDKFYEIAMQNMYNHIAIYNRFKTNTSIFDGTYEGQKNIFVLSRRTAENAIYTKCEDICDNFRTEVIVDFYSFIDETYEDNENLKKMHEEYIENIENKIEEIKKMAQANPNKAYIYTNLSEEELECNEKLRQSNIKNAIFYIYGEYCLYEMDRDYYDSTYYKEIGEFYRGLKYKSVDAKRYEIFRGKPDLVIEQEEIRKEKVDIYTGKKQSEIFNENGLDFSEE